MYWIAQYNATVDEFGYNISKGGDGGDHYWAGLSVEDRIKHNKKISRSKAGKSQGPHTPNTRKKMSDNFNRDPKLIEQRAASRRKVYTCVNHTTLEIFVTYNLKEFCSTNKLSYGLIQGNARQRKSLCYGIWSCSEGDLVDQGLILIQSIEVDITKSLQLIREKLRTKNNQGENNPMWGKKHSDATKDKMRLSKIKKSSNINE
jgi:hypothetical protein